jgi:calcineurin-like phosphoesterase family protein
MTIWFTADTHFGHANIIKFMGRPFAHTDEMDEAMIQTWNNTVQEKDVVYMLGDFSFHNVKQTNQILYKLNGNLHLIKGNHDSSKNLKKMHTWRWVKDYYELRHEGQLTVLSHYPFQVWRDSHRGSWHLHGHSHGTLPRKGKRMDVGVDALGFDNLLISYEEVEAYMKATREDLPDYHIKRK